MIKTNRNERIPQMQDASQPEAGTRAADTVVAEIERRIAAGILADGAPLPAERALVEEFRTSRTVIREAITALSNRGLVEAKPRFRPVVRRPGYASVMATTGPAVRQLLGQAGGVRTLFEARVFVERGLVRDAAQGAGKAEIAALKTALQANHDAIGDSDAFYQTDRAFHRVLYTIPGSPLFPALHDGFAAWLAPHWARMERSHTRNRRNHEAHAAIYHAILERDPDAAERAMAAHLEAAWEQVKDTFGGAEPG